MGEAITATGIPASDRPRTASSRRGGVAARGSIVRASLRSSVVTETATLTRFFSAICFKMAMSRSTNDADRMIAGIEHLQKLPSDPPFLLNRLIRIRVRAYGDDTRFVIGFGQFPFQQLCGVRFGKQPAFEIEPGRKTHESVGRPRKTIDAAVFAAAIRID